MSCAVKGCSNARRFKPEGISFYRFPKGDTFIRWVEILKLGDQYTWSENKFVCSKHFGENDFVKFGGRLSLKPNAVPNKALHLKDFVDTRSTSSIQGRMALLTSPMSLLDDTADSDTNFTLRHCFGESSPSQDTLASNDSSTKRKLVKVIQTIHNYCTPPGKIRKKCLELKKSQLEVRKKCVPLIKPSKR